MKRNVIRRLGLSILLAALVLLVMPAGLALADGVPVTPHAFSGTIFTDDCVGEVPAGHSMRAKVNGEWAGEPLLITEAGRFGGPGFLDPKLIVQGDFISGVTIIEFYVGNVLCEPTAVFHSGWVSEIDLCATGPLGPPTPPPPGPGGGGPGGGPPLPEIEVGIDGRVSRYPLGPGGELLGTIRLCTVIGDLCILIRPGTEMLDEDGNPLTELDIEVDEDPACPPPGDGYIIGLPYSFEPDGATFDPPIEVTWTYEEADIPDGIAEEDLVLAFCNESTGEWVILEDFTVDTDANVITAEISHFTTLAILGFSIPPEPPAFTPSSLLISPAEVEIGETVTISISVANTGGLAGSYSVTLKIDGVTEETKEVTVAAGASEGVTFTTARDEAGTYSVDVNGLTGSFEVMEEVIPPPEPAAFTPSSLRISPAEADIDETVTISISVANTGGQSGSYTVTLKIDGVTEETKEVTVAAGASKGVTFTTARDEAGTYSVDVNGLTGSFEVVPPPKPPTNWPLIGGIIGGVIVVGLLVYFFAFRKRA